MPGAPASPFAGLLGDRHSRTACCWSLVSALCGVAIGLGAITVALDSPSRVVYACAGSFRRTSPRRPTSPPRARLFPIAARTPAAASDRQRRPQPGGQPGFLIASLAAGLLLGLTSGAVAFAFAAVAALLTGGRRRHHRPRHPPHLRGGRRHARRPPPDRDLAPRPDGGPAVATGQHRDHRPGPGRGRHRRDDRRRRPRTSRPRRRQRRLAAAAWAIGALVAGVGLGVLAPPRQPRRRARARLA